MDTGSSLHRDDHPEWTPHNFIQPRRSNSVPPELLTERYAPVIGSLRRHSFATSSAGSISSRHSDLYTTAGTSATSDDASLFCDQEEHVIHASSASSPAHSSGALGTVSLSPGDFTQKLMPASMLLGHLPLCAALQYIVIDSTSLLQVTPIFDNSNTQPSYPDIFVNVDGPELGRQGAVATLAIYRWSLNKVFILDISTIGQAAFHISLMQGQTLQEVIQSEDIHKVFFDARSAADALYYHFGIALQGVIEVQLLEFGARRGMKSFLKGLLKCVQGNMELSRIEREDFRSTRERLRSTIHLECGAEEPLLCTRPLEHAVIVLTILDVAYIASTWDYYDRQVRLDILPRITAATQARIAKSFTLDYNGQGEHMAKSPW